MRDKSLRSGERQYGSLLQDIEKWHKWRYEEATKYIKDKIVLDAGCGVGYGSYIMAEKAKKIYAFDDSEPAIAFAINHYFRPNIEYRHADFYQMPFDILIPDIQVVVAYEFIEHLPDTDLAFLNFKQIKPEFFIISTPHIKCPIGSNQFHHKHYGMDEIIDRFWQIGYKPKRAELLYFGNSLTNFYIGERI